jgi:hypothetical protein
MGISLGCVKPTALRKGAPEARGATMLVVISVLVGAAAVTHRLTVPAGPASLQPYQLWQRELASTTQ